MRKKSKVIEFPLNSITRDNNYELDDGLSVDKNSYGFIFTREDLFIIQGSLSEAIKILRNTKETYCDEKIVLIKSTLELYEYVFITIDNVINNLNDRKAVISFDLKLNEILTLIDILKVGIDISTGEESKSDSYWDKELYPYVVSLYHRFNGFVEGLSILSNDMCTN